MLLNFKYSIALAAVLFCVGACVEAFALDRGSFGAFHRSLNNKRHGYSVVPDPTGSAPAKQVERFEVRPGDCWRDKVWDDCKRDRERSELTESKKNTHPGGEYWYGWSIYLPSDWTNVWPTKVALGQFHQLKAHVVWMFQNDRGGLFLDQQVSGRTDRKYPLLEAEEMAGRWNRIEVHARWSHDADGFLRVYVNGERKVDYSGQTMTAKSLYFKYGLYRSFMSRYRNKHDVRNVPAQTAYYANIRRANTREGLR